VTFVDVHADFAVAELAYVDAAQFRVQLFGDRLRQRAVGIAGEKLSSLISDMRVRTEKRVRAIPLRRNS